jgi:hypothetical protein
VDWDEGSPLLFVDCLGLAFKIFGTRFLLMAKKPLFLTFIVSMSISYMASSPFWATSPSKAT